MKPGVYLRDWGEEGLELGIFVSKNWEHDHFNPYKGWIETSDFIYFLNLDQWIYVGEYD